MSTLSSVDDLFARKDRKKKRAAAARSAQQQQPSPPTTQKFLSAAADSGATSAAATATATATATAATNNNTVTGAVAAGDAGAPLKDTPAVGSAVTATSSGASGANEDGWIEIEDVRGSQVNTGGRTVGEFRRYVWEPTCPNLTPLHALL